MPWHQRHGQRPRSGVSPVAMALFEPTASSRSPMAQEFMLKGWLS
jgi:hypothetical protein